MFSETVREIKMTTTEDIPYRAVDGHTLEARLYRPETPNGKWLVDVHGGAWGSGDKLNNAVIHEDLAANGVGVFALDFRLSDVAQYPDPVQDVIREHTQKLTQEQRDWILHDNVAELYGLAA